MDIYIDTYDWRDQGDAEKARDMLEQKVSELKFIDCDEDGYSNILDNLCEQVSKEVTKDYWRQPKHQLLAVEVINDGITIRGSY